MKIIDRSRYKLLQNGDGGSRTRVRRYRIVCFYVCSLSIESRCDTADKQALSHPVCFISSSRPQTAGLKRSLLSLRP